MPPDGLPTERMLHYWLTKARGGVGLIITHVHNVLPRHTGAPPTAMQRDEVIPAYRRVVEALAPRRLMDAILDGARLGRCL